MIEYKNKKYILPRVYGEKELPGNSPTGIPKNSLVGKHFFLKIDIHDNNLLMHYEKN